MGASAGRVLLIPKGDWNAETTYTGLDWVRHNGAAWVCKNTCTNVEPTEENSDNWQIIARDGQSGSVINVDATMSDTSENPVQNKVIKKYVDDHTPEVDDMTGATADQNGTHGLVPAPKIGDEKKALLGNGTWGNVDAILTYKTKAEYDSAVSNDEIPDGAKVIKEYDEGDSTAIIDVDTVMSDSSENPVQNKVIKKYVDDKQVKHGDGLVVTEDGTLKVSLDGTTLTMDQVNNVIKLADTLKDAINGAFPAANVVNNLTTTEEGFALDARQANPNIDGTLAKQISKLNDSMLLFTIGVIRDESIEKAVTLFHSQHKGYSMEMSFFLDGMVTPNDIPDKTPEWKYCSGKYIVRNSYNNVFDGHIFLFGFGTNRIACKSVTNGVFSSSWDIK